MSTRTCAYCKITGPAELFEPFNSMFPDSLVCKSTTACEYRQNGMDPVVHLGALLRAVRRELAGLTVKQLASLAVDLDGYRGEVLDELLQRPDGQAQYQAEMWDREARRAGR